MTTLYKMDSLGRILYWKVRVEGNTVITNWGQMKQTTAGPRESDSHLQQATEDFEHPDHADFKMNSLIREQMARKGYTKEIPKSVPALPMLAQEWDNDVNFKEFAIQPKLDGYRCIGSKQELRSRLNTITRSVPHINEALQGLPDGIKLDGELYIHGADLQTISSYVKRATPHAVSKLIEFCVFDIVMLDTSFAERLETLYEVYNQLLLPHIAAGGTQEDFPIKFVPTALMTTSTQESMHYIKQQHDEYRKMGYEGLIVRDLDSIYEFNKRSPGLRKYKEFVDGEFQIVNVMEGAEKCAVLTVRTGSTTTDCDLAFTRLAKQAVWHNREKYIGRWARVKYQKVLPSGRLFQPKCIDIRQNKEDFHG